MYIINNPVELATSRRLCVCVCVLNNTVPHMLGAARLFLKSSVSLWLFWMI